MIRPGQRAAEQRVQRERSGQRGRGQREQLVVQRLLPAQLGGQRGIARGLAAQRFGIGRRELAVDEGADLLEVGAVHSFSSAPSATSTRASARRARITRAFRFVSESLSTSHMRR